jgi:O-antigen ligase
MARSRSPGAWVLGAVVAPALLLTNVRSALIAALVIAFLAVRPRPGRTAANRARIGLILAMGAVLLIPAAAASNLSQRSSEAADTTSESTGNHIDSLRAAVDSLSSDPMGRGLGTQPGVGDRFRVQTKLTSEDAYLQVGNELGIVAMILFIAMVLLTLRRLKDATARAPSSPLTSAVRSAAVGYAIGGLFLHVWIYLPVSITLWSLAGVVLGAAERTEREGQLVGAPSPAASAGYPYP